MRFHDKTQAGFAADELLAYKEFRAATDCEKAAVQRYPCVRTYGRMLGSFVYICVITGTPNSPRVQSHADRGDSWGGAPR